MIGSTLTPPVKAGQTIELLEMGVDPDTGEPDPDPIPVGERGEVTDCTWLPWYKQWQVCVRWECGRGLHLLCPPDRFKVIADA